MDRQKRHASPPPHPRTPCQGGESPAKSHGQELRRKSTPVPPYISWSSGRWIWRSLSPLSASFSPTLDWGPSPRTLRPSLAGILQVPPLNSRLTNTLSLSQPTMGLAKFKRVGSLNAYIHARRLWRLLPLPVARNSIPLSRVMTSSRSGGLDGASVIHFAEQLMTDGSENTTHQWED